MQTAKTALYHKVAPHAPSESLSPGLILLHGRGANEDDLLGLVPYFPPQFFVVAARAPFPFASGGATWYDTLAVGSPRPEQFAESYERLVEFVREIKDKYPVDPRRLFLLGFSMGAVMSFAFALTHPDEVKGIVAHSGYIPEETSLTFQWTNLKGKSFLVAH